MSNNEINSSPDINKGHKIYKYTTEEIIKLTAGKGYTQEQIDAIIAIKDPSVWIKNNLWLPGTAVPKSVPFNTLPEPGNKMFRQYQYDFLHDNDRFIALRISRQYGKCFFFLTRISLFDTKRNKYVTRRVGFLYLELKIKSILKKLSNFLKRFI